MVPTAQSYFKICVASAVLILVVIVYSRGMLPLNWIQTSVESESNIRCKIHWTISSNKTVDHTLRWQSNKGDSLSSDNCGVGVYVDLDAIRKRLREKTADCKSIEDPVKYWRSLPVKGINFTANSDIKRIQLASLCGGVLYPEFLNAEPCGKIYPFEVFYLSDPPLWDESTVASHVHSTIGLLGSSKIFFVGDTVSLVITMFDKAGRPRLKGGDRIKVWLKDMQFKRSISTKITDFNNGTYLATTILPWTGNIRVMATLRQPREFFRALAYVHRSIKTTFVYAGAYMNSKASEGVPCSALPVVPGFNSSELCNLTDVNGTPWYCGRPSKPELNCSDFQFVRYFRVHIDMPVTPAEDNILKQLINQRNFLSGNISLTVIPAVSGVTRLKDPEIHCNRVPTRSTWNQPTPLGYFYDQKWKSFLCFLPDQIEATCLQNVNMVSYGDSNARIFYEYVQKKVACSESSLVKGGDWKVSKVCENKALNFSVEYNSHSSPFHIGESGLQNYDWLFSPRAVFDSIPSTGRHIIFMSHYLHYTTYHVSVFEMAMVALRDAIVKLLKRSPDVLIVLRGPHVAELIPYTSSLGDVWADELHNIQRRTFRDLQDYVLYVPTWDITIAAEDTHHHPTSNSNIGHVMLQMVCGRTRNSSVLTFTTV